jgi:tetratricopeptide (TPR) repeat protein
MSVFPGAADLAAVEAVCGEDIDAFAGLASLVEKSLVRVLTGPRGEDRYGLLVSISDFAAEQLERSGETARVRDRHADYFRSLAQRPVPLSLVELQDLRARARDNVDDLTLAWQHVLRRGDRAEIAAFPMAFFEALLELDELRRFAECLQVVVTSSEGPTLQLAMALDGLLWLQNEYLMDVGTGWQQQLEQVAAALRRPDVDVRVAVHRGFSESQPAGMLALLREIDALLPLVPDDSPYCAAEMHRLRDNTAYLLLLYVDAFAALEAARRCFEAVGSGPMDASNLARALIELGRPAEALEVVAPMLDLGVVRVMPTDYHRAVCTGARALIELGRPQEALDRLDQWLPEVTRRQWQIEQRRNAVCRVWALLELGRLDEAQSCLQASRPLASERWPDLQLLELRAERLSGRALDPAPAAQMAAQIRDLRWIDTMPIYLGSRVEHALRTVDAGERARLAAEIDSERGPRAIPFGYSRELGELLTS